MPGDIAGVSPARPRKPEVWSLWQQSLLAWLSTAECDLLSTELYLRLAVEQG